MHGWSLAVNLVSIKIPNSGRLDIEFQIWKINYCKTTAWTAVCKRDEVDQAGSLDFAMIWLLSRTAASQIRTERVNSVCQGLCQAASSEE